ncbi:hypothetical protein D3C80_2168460 [compost metagenome]
MKPKVIAPAAAMDNDAPSEAAAVWPPVSVPAMAGMVSMEPSMTTSTARIAARVLSSGLADAVTFGRSC